MDIVGVIFTRDTEPSRYTGHEFYRAGTSAHFYRNHATVLIEQGMAKPLEAAPETPPEPVELDGLTVKQLKDMAKDADLTGYHRLNKSQLIQRLENSQ